MDAEEYLAWSKADIIRPKCNITSLKCRGECYHKPFYASYEKKRNERPSMRALLSWEYARIWHEEHDKYMEEKRKLKAKPKLKFNNKFKGVGNKNKKEVTNKVTKEDKRTPSTCNKSKNQKPKIENSKKQNNDEKPIKEKTAQKEKSVKFVEPKIEKRSDHSKEDKLNPQTVPCEPQNK